MPTDGSSIPRFHYISIQMSPDGAFQLCMGFIPSECSYKTTLAKSPGNVRSQPSRLVTVIVLLLSQGVSEPFIINWKRAVQKKAPDYSAEEKNSFTLPPYRKRRKKAFFWRTWKKLKGGGRESRKDTISQLSTPAWSSGMSWEGFHTWGNNTAEIEDGIKFLHCYPSVSLHQGR